jgi:hypothetical protein
MIDIKNLFAEITGSPTAEAVNYAAVCGKTLYVNLADPKICALCVKYTGGLLHQLNAALQGADVRRAVFINGRNKLHDSGR